MRVLIVLLNRMPYQEALALQENLLKLRQQNAIEDILLLLEHLPTLTVGRNGKPANIIASEEVLNEQGVNIYKVNRGGDVTYHGPGQVVGYPILSLKLHGSSIPDYVRKVEESIIQLLYNDYGISAHREARYPGVWVGNDKIAAIGCAVRRWVTMHGFAINVNTQLEHFEWITPCGIPDKGVTSLQRILGYPQDIDLVNHQVVRYFCEQFSLQPKIITKDELYKIMEYK